MSRAGEGVAGRAVRRGWERHLRQGGVLFLILGAGLLAWAVLSSPSRPAPPAAPATTAIFASGFSQASQTNVLHGRLTVSPVHSVTGQSPSALATYDGSGANGYARAVLNVDWRDGSRVTYGGSFFLPLGFHAAMQGQVALMRWDDYPARPDAPEQGGVVINERDRRAYLERDHLVGGRWEQTEVSGPFDLPEGRWFALQVRQRLSAGDGADSEVWVDGVRVGSSHAATAFGDAIQRVRYGLVAIAEGVQRQPLQLWFDRVVADPGVAG